jgi:NADH-quinone oxidoreductase subunit J
MTPEKIIFIFTAAVTVISALMVVSSRKQMRAALWLVLTLLGVAVIFAMLDSGFFAVVQVLVYIGAIATLIIFAVMLTGSVMKDVGPQVNRLWPAAAVAAAALFGGLVYLLNQWGSFNQLPSSLSAGALDLTAFGLALSSPDGYLVPFEIASVLLVAAMVGSIYVAMERKGGKKS